MSVLQGTDGTTGSGKRGGNVGMGSPGANLVGEGLLGAATQRT